MGASLLLLQGAVGWCAPLGQLNVESLAFARIRRKAGAVAKFGGALKHVDETRFEEGLRVQVALAAAEESFVVDQGTARAELPLPPRKYLIVGDLLWHDAVVGAARARLGAADAPRIGKSERLLGVGGAVADQIAFACGQIIAKNAVVVAAQAAQLVLVRGRRLHLEYAAAVPGHDDAQRGRHRNAVLHVSRDVQPQVIVRERSHPRAVHLHSHLLTQVDLDVAHLQRNGLGPRAALRVARIIRHPNRKRVVLAVTRQQVLARPLEVVVHAVKGLEVGVAPHGAHAGNLFALGAALARRHDQLLVRFAFGVGALGLSTHGTSILAFARLTRTQLPRFIVFVGCAIEGAYGPHLDHSTVRAAVVCRRLFLVFAGTL